MREKLIQLLKDISYFEVLAEKERALAADHLLANGVIVPPCGVGDACFYLRPYKGGRIVVEGVVDDATYTLDGAWTITVKAIKNHFRGWLGAAVFLTREEAEIALERSKE